MALDGEIGRTGEIQQHKERSGTHGGEKAFLSGGR